MWLTGTFMVRVVTGQTMDILRHMLQVSGRRDVALSFIDDFKPENNIVGLPVISFWMRCRPL